MAIRPVDLQLAYMAAPQNAAVLSNAQDSPQAAQQAAQSAFAAEVTQREEQIDQPAKAEGAKIRAGDERGNPGGGQSRRRRQPGAGPPHSDAEQSDAYAPFGFAGEDEHFIDVKA